MSDIGPEFEIKALKYEVERLTLAVEEQRARRLAIEEEFAAVEDTWRTREPEIRTVIRYLDRSPYELPMPKQIIKGPVRYVDRVVEKPTIIESPKESEFIFVRDTERRAGPLGRLGDLLDRLLRLAPG